MKIIFITREGYNLAGARVRCYNFSRELVKYGLDAEVLSFADDLGAKDGAEESRMGPGDKIRLNYRAFRRLVRERGNIFYIQRLNYHSLAPYLAHLLKGNRIILDLDDWEMSEDPKYHFGLYPSSKAHYLTRLIAKRSIFCVAASRFLERFLLQFNRSVYYIPSGVDTELFSPSSGDLSVKEMTFSWLGTFHRKEYAQNIRFALECFEVINKEYPHTRFDITGGGTYRDMLKGMIGRFPGSRVRLKGWLAPENVPGYLRTIHVGLLPVANDTKFNRAKSPTKLFEYMAMAKPVLSSRVGEAAEIISDGENGLLAGSKEEFIAKLRMLIEDIPSHKLLGERARMTVINNYSLQVLGERLRDIFKRI